MYIISRRIAYIRYSCVTVSVASSVLEASAMRREVCERQTHRASKEIFHVCCRFFVNQIIAAEASVYFDII